MPTQIIGFVLRAGDRNVTAQFYEKLGLKAKEHQHGGPMHHEVGPLAEGFVVEIYKKSLAFATDAIMIGVDSLEEAIRAVAEFGIAPKGEIKEIESTRFVYVTDPDGRDVMLIQSETKK